MIEKDLVLALEILTEGQEAELPKTRGGETFATETLLSAAESTKRDSRPWMAASSIQGYGIAERSVDGKFTEDVALKVYVDRKLPKQRVRNPVPSRINLPEFGNVETDVEEIGKVELESFTSRVRPAMPGCGLGQINVTVGTFGCLVENRDDSDYPYILSNSHILADSGLAKIGDAIIQPGKYDGGTLKNDAIAKLAKFVPFQYTTNTFPNLVDAAIARPDRRNLVKPEIRLLNYAPGPIRTNLSRGMQVQKVGRTTDHTVGVIRDLNYRLSLRYPINRNKPPTKRRVGFKDQVLCSRYTAGGDSGSAVLSMNGRLVGLHFAGSPSTSIFNKITHVMNALNI
jgi:hypothetical protein